MTTLECGCVIDCWDIGGQQCAKKLTFCPLHASASETAAERDRLREEVVSVIPYLSAPNAADKSAMLLAMQYCYDRLRAALAADRRTKEGT